VRRRRFFCTILALSSTVLQQLAPILLLREPDGDVIGISNLHGIGGVALVTRWPWVMPVERSPCTMRRAWTKRSPKVVQFSLEQFGKFQLRQQFTATSQVVVDSRDSQVLGFEKTPK
jgi:hypothetical protein